MEYTILEDGRYQLSFSVEESGKVLRDSLVISSDEYAALTLDTFENIKRERFIKWQEQVEYMTANPSNPPSDPLANKRRING